MVNLVMVQKGEMEGFIMLLVAPGLMYTIKLASITANDKKILKSIENDQADL